MTDEIPAFEFTPTTIAFGRNCVSQLGNALDRRGLERALVVCGSNVGANRDMLGPVTEGLGEKSVAVFDEPAVGFVSSTATDRTPPTGCGKRRRLEIPPSSRSLYR